MCRPGRLGCELAAGPCVPGDAAPDIEGLAARVLESRDITVGHVRANVVRIVGAGEEATSGQIPFTPRTKKLLELGLREALNLGHDYIGTEHILLGLVRENEGGAARILLDFGVDAEMIRNELIRMLSGPGAREQARSMAISSRISRLVIDQAWLGGLDAVLNRLAAEIRDELKRAPDTGDLLLTLAHAPNTLAARALRELGVDLAGLRAAIETHPRPSIAGRGRTRPANQGGDARQRAGDRSPRV